MSIIVLLKRDKGRKNFNSRRLRTSSIKAQTRMWCVSRPPVPRLVRSGLSVIQARTLLCSQSVTRHSGLRDHRDGGLSRLVRSISICEDGAGRVGFGMLWLKGFTCLLLSSYTVPYYSTVYVYVFMTGMTIMCNSTKMLSYSIESLSRFDIRLRKTSSPFP